jgi:hypothetical protein
VRVLDVIDRVVVRLALGQIEVEIEVLVGLAQDIEEAAGIVADIFAQRAQGDEIARTRRHLGLPARAIEHGKLHQRHFEHIRIKPQSADCAPDSWNIAVMVGSPDVDDALEAAFVFVEVVGDVRREVGVKTVVALHDAILLVAKSGRPEPAGAILNVEMTFFVEPLDATRDQADIKQRLFGKPHVEMHTGFLEIPAAICELLGENEVVQGFPLLAKQLLGPGNQRIELGFTLLPGGGVGAFGIGQVGQAFADAGERSQVTVRMCRQLPPALIDAAFLDRIHGYIPGWEIPKISNASLAGGVGFVVDYFGEVLKELRTQEVASQFSDLRIEAPATVRDERGAMRIAAGMFKLLFPDGVASDEDRRACLRFGVELRQRVHNQLTRIAPGEFSRRAISFPGMAEQDARDLVETQKLQQRDARANRDPLVGHVTGLVVLSRGDTTISGDVFFIEVSRLNGRPGPSVTGLRGKVLEDSVRTAYQTLQLLPAPWNTAAARLASGQTAVHLVNIADPKDGPSAGITFVTAMVSAALGLPVRPGLAMTGEVSLHGSVEAVGGIPQKIVAAAHHQRRTVIIPAANAADLRDVPDDVLGKIEIITVERIEDVLQYALLPTLEGNGAAG